VSIILIATPFLTVIAAIDGLERLYASAGN